MEGERQVHVVAAEKQVVAHRDAAQCQLPALVLDGDEAQVGRPAAEIAHQHQVAGAHLLAPLVAACLDPGVDGGLRLLEQARVAESGAAGGL